MKLKQEEMSEVTVRKEMAEKKLGNVNKDYELTIEKLQVSQTGLKYVYNIILIVEVLTVVLLKVLFFWVVLPCHRQIVHNTMRDRKASSWLINPVLGSLFSNTASLPSRLTS